KGLKVHFKKGVFIPVAIGVFSVSTVFVIFSKIYPPVDTVLLNRIIKAPIYDAFKALDINYDKSSAQLKESGILIDKATTIEEIWIENDSNPEEVIDLIIE